METTASNVANKAASKAEEAVEKTKGQMKEVGEEAKKRLRKSAEFIRENPKQSALSAFGLGIVLAQLPLRILATALMGLFLLLLKPAAFLYAGIKLVEGYRSSSSSSAPAGHQGFSNK